MLKKRLIFTLLFDNGNFFMSRNFNLQLVGDVEWLLDNFQLNSLMRSVDELIILDVSRGESNIDLLVKTINILSKNAFMPISVGGKIDSIEKADILFKNGADKIVINTLFFKNSDVITAITKKYGIQSLICSLDYKKIKEHHMVFIENGELNTNYKLQDALNLISEIGVGELYLTSIDKDGLGYGYDLEVIKQASEIVNIPIIASGGSDNGEKLFEGINKNYIQAVSTSNLFNFIFDGLYDARNHIINNKIDLSHWDFSRLEVI